MAEWKYHPDNCLRIVELMSKGLFNYELAADLKISEKQFYSWLDKIPEFQDAFQTGLACRKTFYASAARERFLAGDDKGYKYFQALASNELGFNQPETANKQINIGQVNVISSKSREDLLEYIQAKLEKLPIDVEFETIEIKPDESK